MACYGLGWVQGATYLSGCTNRSCLHACTGNWRSRGHELQLSTPHAHRGQSGIVPLGYSVIPLNRMWFTMKYPYCVVYVQAYSHVYIPGTCSTYNVYNSLVFLGQNCIARLWRFLLAPMVDIFVAFWTLHPLLEQTPEQTAAVTTKCRAVVVLDVKLVRVGIL